MHISSETLTTGYSGTHFVIEKTSRFFVVSFTIITLIVAAAMGLAGILMLLLLSHRIAGPLYRFEKILGEMSGGVLRNRVNIRKTDQLKKMEAAFNLALENMNSQLKGVKSDLEKVHKLTLHKGTEKHMEEIQEIISAIKEKMEFFKTS